MNSRGFSKIEVLMITDDGNNVENKMRRREI
jgi:hypothetical protein